MDVEYHYTHWNVRPDVGQLSGGVCERFGGTWNTYYDHPPGYGLDATSVDHWGDSGRGDAISERVGDQIVAWVLGQHVLYPVRWLIWFGWIWQPDTGWVKYYGWQGDHTDHVHITYA